MDKDQEKAVSRQKVVVAGAGIVGVVTALNLIREGFEVTLIDRDKPGSGCSFGNAGLLARSSFVPLSSRSTLLQVPGWLLNKQGPLSVRWRYLFKMLPWLLNYIKAGFAKDLREKGEAINNLTASSVERYKALVASAGCEELITETDYLQIYRSKGAFDKAEFDMNERRRLGYNICNLNQRDLQALEPALAEEFHYGHHLHDHGFVKDPGELVSALARQFCLEGGEFIEETIEGLSYTQDSCTVVTNRQQISCHKLVIAAGAFSARLTAMLGVKIPLETERGYHITCPNPALSISRPIMEGDGKFLVSPMNMGIRFAGTVELAGLDAPENEKRIAVIETGAKKMLPQLNSQARTQWLGFRPTLPDSLPVISSVPDKENVILAFGHQHLGLTCAPVTAELVTDIICGRKSTIDMSLYDVKRFF